MLYLENMTEIDKARITPETIAYAVGDIPESEIIARIKYLLDKQKRELTETLSEDDYKFFYNEAKEYWTAMNMEVKGNTKEIQSCMWEAFEKAGIPNIRSKKDFFKVPKALFKNKNVDSMLYNTIMR